MNNFLKRGMKKQMNVKLSENTPCPCGSEKMFKQCCGENVHFLGKIRTNSIESDFLGLSPNQMHTVLYKPFSLLNEVFNFSCASNPVAETLPIIQHALFFLKKLLEVDEIKCTQKGNLPKSIVLESYHKFFASERFHFVPNNENDLPQLTRLKYLLDLCGFIKKRNNKISLTKKAQVVLKEYRIKELYEELFLKCINEWNWGYDDRFAEFRLIQASAVFNFLLLHAKAQEWISGEELAQYYLKAFPALRYEARDTLSSDREIIHCFNIRFLERFCVPFGLLTSKEEGTAMNKTIFFKISPFLKDSFEFKI